jgi:uncharacterized sporulation protein YeaH/YhbH (DUF444 family)
MPSNKQPPDLVGPWERFCSAMDSIEMPKVAKRGKKGMGKDASNVSGRDRLRGIVERAPVMYATYEDLDAAIRDIQDQCLAEIRKVMEARNAK